MPIQPDIEKRGEEGFTITYFYKGVERSCYVKVIRTSSGELYSISSRKSAWNLQKVDGVWTVTSPRQMDPELLKAIGVGIDGFLADVK